MDEKICDICHQPSEGDLLTVDGHENICWDCATKMAVEAKKENREIEIELEHAGYSETCHLCTWCEDLYPESELREEVDLGHLCDRCIAAISSRGEPRTIKY